MSADRMTAADQRPAADHRFYRGLLVALLIGAVVYAALGVAVWAAVTR